MDRWMLAHSNGLDELVVLAFGTALALAVRLLVAGQGRAGGALVGKGPDEIGPLRPLGRA